MANNPFIHTDNNILNENDTVRGKEYKELFDKVIANIGSIVPHTTLATATRATDAGAVPAADVIAAFGNILFNSAAMVPTLPAAASYPYDIIRFDTAHASTITVTPASGESIKFAGVGTADSTLILAAVVGNFVELYSNGTNWVVSDAAGGLSRS